MSNQMVWQWKWESVGTDRANDIVNTWHFTIESVPPSAATLNAINAALVNFYNSLSTMFASALITGNWTTKIYNLADPKPRIPVTSYNGSIAGLGSGQALPPEVCCVMTYAAIPVAGVNQQRRRGRVYLGPFVVGQIGTNTGWSSATQTGIKSAGNALLTSSTGAADWKWVVHSTVANSSAPVSTGYVDSLTDIQRRRGLKVGVRQTFP